MTDADPDYTKYTIEDLYDVRRKIDSEQFPDRARTVELLIRDREEAARRKPPRVSIADDEGNIAAVKPGRGVSFGRGIAEIVSSLVFLGFVFFSGFIDLNDPNAKFFAAFAVLACTSAFIAGAFHLYNAFAARRFTEHDIVAPNKEADPFDRFTGKR